MINNTSEQLTSNQKTSSLPPTTNYRNVTNQKQQAVIDNQKRLQRSITSSTQIEQKFAEDELTTNGDLENLVGYTYTDIEKQGETKVPIKNLNTSDEQNTTQEQNADKLLENIGLYISANDEKQQGLLDSVTKSLNAITPQEREGIIRGTANAFSAFEKGIDLKAGAKWGGYTAGIGLVSVLGGCLAAAAAQGGDLGANLKDIMSQVFPEALVALAAAALLIAVARTLFGAFSGAAEQIASANDKRIVANAQEQINTALNDIKKNPLNVEAFKKLEDATKTLIEHGSTQILGKNGKEMTPIMTLEQVTSYKGALQGISQARLFAKLQTVKNLLQNDKESQRDVPMLKAVKNTVKGKSDRNTEKNEDHAKRLAQKLGIKMSSTSKTLAPPTPGKKVDHKTLTQQ